MKELCLKADEIDAVLRAGASAGRRRHIETCPRCRALLLDYEEFLGMASVPEDARVEGATRRLRDAFLKALEETPAPGAGRKTGGSFGGRLSRPSFRRLLRPSLAVAAIAMIVVGIYGGIDMLRHRLVPSDVGEAPTRGVEDEGRILLLPAVRGGDGSLEIRWRSRPGIANYQVRLIGSDLADLARYGPFGDTLLVLPEERLCALLPPGGIAGIQVLGLLEDGTPAAASSIQTIRVP